MLRAFVTGPAFYPVCLAGCMVAYFSGAHFVTAGSLDPNLARLPGTVVAGVFLGLCVLLERLVPFDPAWNRDRKDTLVDAALTVLVLPVIVLACELALRSAKSALALPTLWPTHLPFVLQLVLAVLAAELCFYGIHRVAHRQRWLWRFHRTHHAVERVYSLNSGRFHLVDAAINFVVYFLPLLLLGVPDDVFLAFLTLSLITGILEHTNIAYDAGPLSYVFNTAQLHRWHHSYEAAESQRNYGKILCVWDLVFRTHHLRRTEAPARVGAEPL